MEWDGKTVSQSDSNLHDLPATDVGKTYHQLYQEWVNWKKAWLPAGTYGSYTSDGLDCSLSVHGDRLTQTCCSENYIFYGHRNHDVRVGATGKIESNCGTGFLCDAEVARVWTALNGGSHLSQTASASSLTTSFAPDVLSFWQGFGARYGKNAVEEKVTVMPPATGGATGQATALLDTYKQYTDLYYQWLGTGQCVEPISAEAYVWSGTRPSHTYNSYKNLYDPNDATTSPNHQCSCSRCGKTGMIGVHMHNNVASNTECDLCGYRQGMPGGFEYGNSTGVNASSISSLVSQIPLCSMHSGYKCCFKQITIDGVLCNVACVGAQNSNNQLSWYYNQNNNFHLAGHPQEWYPWIASSDPHCGFGFQPVSGTIKACSIEFSSVCNSATFGRHYGYNGKGFTDNCVANHVYFTDNFDWGNYCSFWYWNGPGYLTVKDIRLYV